jgi:hypothetical protein
MKDYKAFWVDKAIDVAMASKRLILFPPKFPKQVFFSNYPRKFLGVF